MPHDKNGKLLKAGDEVIVRCEVKTIHAGEEFCNLQVETIEPMFPMNNRIGITLNTKQVELVEKALSA
jgi:hypothetical protein